MSDGRIDQSLDEQSLNIRLGYMRFWDSSNNDDGNPWEGKLGFYRELELLPIKISGQK